MQGDGTEHDALHWPVEFDGITTAYPQLVLRHAPPGIWVSGRIAPVPRYARSAHIVMVVPADATIPVRTWAWSAAGVALGPRHVNPDGSVCAYEPNEPNPELASWRRGQPILALLDLVTTWIARQFYLVEFGRWPGMQSLHTALERLEWQQPGELCGCPEGTKPYDACHRETDRGMSDAELLRELRGIPRHLTLAAIRDGLRLRPAPLTVEALTRAASAPLLPCVDPGPMRTTRASRIGRDGRA